MQNKNQSMYGFIPQNRLGILTGSDGKVHWYYR